MNNDFYVFDLLYFLLWLLVSSLSPIDSYIAVDNIVTTRQQCEGLPLVLCVGMLVMLSTFGIVGVRR